MADRVLYKLIFAELAKKFHALYGIGRFMTVFTRFFTWLFVVLYISNFFLTAPAELCGVNQRKCTSAFGMLPTPYPIRWARVMGCPFLGTSQTERFGWAREIWSASCVLHWYFCQYQWHPYRELNFRRWRYGRSVVKVKLYRYMPCKYMWDWGYSSTQSWRWH